MIEEWFELVEQCHYVVYNLRQVISSREGHKLEGISAREVLVTRALLTCVGPVGTVWK